MTDDDQTLLEDLAHVISDMEGMLSECHADEWISVHTCCVDIRGAAMRVLELLDSRERRAGDSDGDDS